MLDSARSGAVGVSGECALFPGTGVTAPLNPGPYLTLWEIEIQKYVDKAHLYAEFKLELEFVYDVVLCGSFLSICVINGDHEASCVNDARLVCFGDCLDKLL